MRLFLLFLFTANFAQAAEFCTVVANENFHEFNKIYTLKVTSFSCTNGAQFSFKEEKHRNIENWAQGHDRIFPTFSSNLLKTMSDAGWTFKMSNNRENSTNFFFHREK